MITIDIVTLFRHFFNLIFGRLKENEYNFSSLHLAFLNLSSSFLSVIQVDQELYSETTHGLALKIEQERVTCVGYFKESSSGNTTDEILPLTPELENWCQQRDIICI